MPQVAHSMTAIAPTVTRALGLRDLTHATGTAIEAVLSDLEGSARMAIIGPDALGQASLEHFAAEMPFLSGMHGTRHLVLRSVMPSITPVNFATMVTGCELEVHGVSAKQLPVQSETIFDVLAEAGRRGAGCGRPGYTGAELLARIAQIDGTAELPDDAATEEVVVRIARDDRPEFLIAQLGGTDDHFHRFGPYSARMIPKLRETDCRLERMTAELAEAGYALMILSDHGQHESGNAAKMGTHGSDCDEDRLVPLTWRAAR